MDQTAVIAMSLLAIGLSVLIVIRLNRAARADLRERLRNQRELAAYGDVVRLPDEMAAARKTWGDEAASGSGQHAYGIDVRTHRGESR